jgi:hypothetical protein
MAAAASQLRWCGHDEEVCPPLETIAARGRRGGVAFRHRFGGRLPDRDVRRALMPPMSKPLPPASWKPSVESDARALWVLLTLSVIGVALTWYWAG